MGSDLTSFFVEIIVTFLLSIKYIDEKFKTLESKISENDTKNDRRCDELEAFIRRTEAVGEADRKDKLIKIVFHQERQQNETKD